MFKKRIVASVMALCLTSTAFAYPSLSTYADDVDEDVSIGTSDGDTTLDEDSEETEALYVEQTTYSDYYDEYSTQPRPDKEIVINATDYTSAEDGDFSVEKYEGSSDDVLVWDSLEGSVTYDFEVEETGIYCLEMSYFNIVSTSNTIELSVSIDGEVPYSTASRIQLNKVWVNSEDIKEDENGNQVRPSQVQEGMWQVTDIKDVDGLFNDPLIFYLEKGKHSITIDGTRANIALEYLKFHNPEDVATYDEYVDSVDTNVTVDSTPSTLIRVEGEQADYKSSSTLYPTYDKDSYMVSPSDPVKQMYNTIGDATWSQALQTITWKVNVENDGWYKLGIKSRQQEMRGFYSNRRIYIDGEVPCEELNQVKFYYSTDWSVVTPQDEDGNDIYVYLSAGEHELSMEVIPGEIGESMRQLDDIVLTINNYYRQILMITSPNPDKYTDYYVHTKIPDLVDTFAEISQQLKDIQNNIETLSNSEGSEASTLEQMTVILDKCVEKPLQIPNYLSQIKDNVTAISSWMRDYREQPLEIDYIELASADQEFSSIKGKFFKSLSFSFQSFIGSFTEDYNVLTDTSSEDTITVWVGLGRDQAQVVKELVESEFTPETGIPVAVNLVQGTLVEATLAGKGPDVSLFSAGELPVNLAVRGLLTDLSQFDDFDEVASRFQENATVPYTYDGSCYGIPLEQNFPMMFYRKDVLSELGFDHAPETWDELLEMLPAFQRSYMSVGLVTPTVNVSASTEAGHTFATLMLQNGLNYFNEDQTATTFNEITAVQAFEQWTDFYTKYGFEQTYDAFNRFRTGEYPIVIQNYSFFNQLSVASPEINGLWDMTEIPGTLQEDGTISHATNSSGTCGIIFNKVSSEENAWEFLKWFSSTEIQVQYGTSIEGLMGQMGRYATANTEALTQLAWSASELATLQDQQEELDEIPIIPASYAVTRNVMNAFRETVNNAENPRDTLMWYNRDINAEITRKRENLGLD
jgi:ABC-type glycerol-3-phosphate transport system substrate-binding protein